MINSKRIINRNFFLHDVVDVASSLLGCYIVRLLPDGQIIRLKITETEAYRGTDDKACHASKGKTNRTNIMFGEGGHVYMYLIYGMYWMLNIVTAEKENPQAVLIRGLEGINGPGRVSKYLLLDKSFYGEDLCSSERIWIEERMEDIHYQSTPRIGIDYAGEYWANVPWRFVMDEKQDAPTKNRAKK
jgi:DNA-3-methyladenine glycosylase